MAFQLSEKIGPKENLWEYLHSKINVSCNLNLSYELYIHNNTKSYDKYHF